MKPDWEDAPEWANYLAMDYDGTWYWYEFKPKWIEEISLWRRNKTGFVQIAYIAPGVMTGAQMAIANCTCYESLEKRPNQ